MLHPSRAALYFFTSMCPTGELMTYLLTLEEEKKIIRNTQTIPKMAKKMCKRIFVIAFFLCSNVSFPYLSKN